MGYEKYTKEENVYYRMYPVKFVRTYGLERPNLKCVYVIGNKIALMVAQLK